jgi:hypothetical protein
MPLMPGIRRALIALGCFVIIAAASASDNAEAHTVRFVASNGDDANNCTRDAPCLTLQRGIDRTPAGSELIILDSGDFDTGDDGGGATINKSITISAAGVSATIRRSITVNNPEATVVLRGLRLSGTSTAFDGVSIIEAAAVHVEDCDIQRFGYGIAANTSAYPMLFISGSVLHNNGVGGLSFATGSPGRLVVDNSRFEHNLGNGLLISTAEATITRTIVSGNGLGGIAHTGGKANVTWTTAEHNGGSGYAVSSGQMTLEQSVARGNAIGLHVTGSGTARISTSVVTNNITGVSVESGATLLTRQNSTISGNTTNVSGVLTLLAGI